MGYNLSLSAQYPGITLRQIDTITSLFTIDTMTPAGTYQETLTVADANGYTETKKFTFTVDHAKRTLNLYKSRETISGIETATIYPFVDSSTPLMSPALIGSDGTINYSAGNSTGCTVTPTTGIVTPAFSGGTCLITGVVSQGNYYSSAHKSISLKVGGTVDDIAYFSSNDESETFNSISGVHNSTIQIPEAPTRLGYEFVGWSQSTLGDSLIAPGTKITLNGDVTYYAIWRDPLTKIKSTNKAKSIDAPFTLSPGAPITLSVLVDSADLDGTKNWFSLPLNSTSDESLTALVDWGDGSATESITPSSLSEHMYSAAGSYTVTVTGRVPAFGLPYTGWNNSWESTAHPHYDSSLLTAITSFGELGTTTMSNLFSSFPKNVVLPGQIPSTVTDLSYMFDSASQFNNSGLTTWNTSNVTTTFRMFGDATLFNQDISGWNLGNVTTMNAMFQGATSFNQNLTTWNTSNVTDMKEMFNRASAFNGDISSWNTSKVFTFISMFDGASAFNQNTSSWSTSALTALGVNPISSARDMFKEAASLNAPWSQFANFSSYRNIMFSGDNLYSGYAVKVPGQSALHGSVDLDTQVVGVNGGTVTFTFTANQGSAIDSITLGTTKANVAGFNKNATSFSYTFTATNPAVNKYLTGYFYDSQTVTYAAGLGSGSLPSEGSHFEGETFTLGSGSSLTLADKHFTGWSDGSRVYQAGAVYTMPRFSVTLTAQFAFDTFTVTYNANGGSADTTLAIIKNSDVITQAPTVTKSGNTFLGWSLDGTSIVTSLSAIQDFTLIAQWSPNPYTISATTSAHGRVDSNVVGPVTYGSDVTYTFTPDSGYFLYSLKVDGVDTTPVTAYTFTGVTSTHTIAGVYKMSNPTISSSVGIHGSVDNLGSVAVPSGGDKSDIYTAISTYHLATLTVDGTQVGLPGQNNDGTWTYTFTNVIEPHTIAATFEIDTYTISFDVGPGLNVSLKVGSSSTPVVGGVYTATSGSRPIFIFTTKPGYLIDQNSLQTGLVGQLSSDDWTGQFTSNLAYYSFVNGVYDNYAVQITETILTFGITSTAGANGTVSPLANAGDRLIAYGSDDTITMIPDLGYHVDAVYVDGTNVGPVTTYVFRNITVGHSLNASFAIDTHTLVASVSGSGAISSSGSTVLNYGESKSYTITPSSH